jgi:hypothetical protein
MGKPAARGACKDPTLLACCFFSSQVCIGVIALQATRQDLPDIMAGPDAAVLPARPVAEAGGTFQPGKCFHDKLCIDIS